jgi:hypothetical protein
MYRVKADQGNMVWPPHGKHKSDGQQSKDFVHIRRAACGDAWPSCISRRHGVARSDRTTTDRRGC